MLLRRTEGISEWGRIVEQAVAACRGRSILFLLFLQGEGGFSLFCRGCFFARECCFFTLFVGEGR